MGVSWLQSEDDKEGTKISFFFIDLKLNGRTGIKGEEEGRRMGRR